MSDEWFCLPLLYFLALEFYAMDKNPPVSAFSAVGFFLSCILGTYYAN
jgi:hypothetical protein